MGARRIDIQKIDSGEGRRAIRMLGRDHIREIEQVARTLASLSRTLREIAAVNGADETILSHDVGGDAVPRDIDEFRDALARRIENVVAARLGTEEHAVPADGSRSKPARGRRR